MIYKILIEQNGKFVDLGETIECEFEQTQEIIDALQLEHGCCCALEAVSRDPHHLRKPMLVIVVG